MSNDPSDPSATPKPTPPPALTAAASPNPSPPKLPAPPAVADDPQDHLPVTGFASAIESILRQPRRVLNHLSRGGSGALAGAFLFIAVVACLVYGFVVGTFSGGTQLWAAPVKVAGGLLFSALICLPSLYIFSCLSGSTARLGQVCGLVAGMLALLSVLLVGFAPVAWVFSQSTESVVAMGILHLLFWLIAAWFALRFLNQGFGFLGDKTGGFKVWVCIFIMVMLQMTTTVRPLVGKAPTLMPQEKKFFIAHWLDSMERTTETAASEVTSDGDGR